MNSTDNPSAPKLASNLGLKGKPQAADPQAVINFLSTHAQAIAAYNASVEQHGVFSDGLRSF
jgi:hypothetical protein